MGQPNLQRIKLGLGISHIAELTPQCLRLLPSLPKSDIKLKLGDKPGRKPMNLLVLMVHFGMGKCCPKSLTRSPPPSCRRLMKRGPIWWQRRGGRWKNKMTRLRN